jgi:hypothetical protein
MKSRHSDAICKRWQKFSAFLKDVGRRPKPDYVLMRLNRDRPFAPGNVAWRPRGELTRDCLSIYIEHAGMRLSIKDWAQKVGISPERMRQRIAKCQRYGADVREAITTPAGKRMPCTVGRYRPKKNF